MTPRERNILNSYERSELLDMLKCSFEIRGPISFNGYKEKFTYFGATGKESFDFNISYFDYDRVYYMRDISIRTWDGGWTHRQRSTYIEYSWPYPSGSGSERCWVVNRTFPNSTEQTISKKLESKEEIFTNIIDYFNLIEPDIAKPMIRYNNLKSILI